MEEKPADPLMPIPPDMWEGLIKNSHASHVIWVSALLDEGLQALIEHKMPNISNNLRESLFTGYGPLASFSARIDIAYALDCISVQRREDLLHIKALRNKFAHASERLDLRTGKPRELLARMRNYKADMDPLAFFMERGTECYNDLSQLLKKASETSIMLKALRLHRSSRPASQEK